MSPRSRGGRFVADVLGSKRSPYICNSCKNSITRRRYASTATAAVEDASSFNETDETSSMAVNQPQVTIKAGVVLSRPPLMTAEEHPFETAFHLYQRRLNERLALPFTQYFHFKKGTPAFEHWRTKRRERGGVAARDIGRYDAYSKEGWNDEVLVGDKCGTTGSIIEQLVAEEGRGSDFAAGDEEAAKVAGLKRSVNSETEANEKSLERCLDRTLYLLVKDKASGEELDWKFPSGTIKHNEGLKEAAKRVLDDSCGQNMNTWIVASHPVGHCVQALADHTKDSTKDTLPTSKAETEATYFLKARIFAGQVNLEDNSYGLQDFKWLPKEKIEKAVSPAYWTSIKNMLVEQ